MLFRTTYLLSILLVTTFSWGAEPPVKKSFTAVDSLSPGPESIPDAQECLQGLMWTPAPFPVTLEWNDMPLEASIVRFPSAMPTGNEINDLVALEWYPARGEKNEVIEAP